MSKENAVLLAARALAILFTTWAVVETSHLPEYIQSLAHYTGYEVSPSTNLQYLQYWRHHLLVEVGFLIARIVGLSLLAGWLFKGGSEVVEFLLPLQPQENAFRN